MSSFFVSLIYGFLIWLIAVLVYMGVNNLEQYSPNPLTLLIVPGLAIIIEKWIG